MGVVGTGRVGAVLGAALARAGHRVVAASAVSQASRERAATLLPGVPIQPVPDVVARAELVLIAVPDDVLPDLVNGLSAIDGWPAGALAVHTSGRYGISVLDSAVAQHVLPLALHPAMTFTGTAMDLDRLADCRFGVTAPAALRLVAEALVVEMGADPVWVEEDERAGYHAGLAHGSNHLVTLVAQAMEILRAAGVEQPAQLLRPLLTAALDNSLRLGDAALTGPVARGDTGTLTEHLALLRAQHPDIEPAYRTMAQASARRAIERGSLGDAAARAVLQVLSNAEGERP